MNSKSPRFRHVVVSGSLALTFALIFAGGACGGGSSGSGTAGHAGGTAGAVGTAGATGTAGAAGATGTAGAVGTAGATGTAGAAAANTPVGQCEQFVSTFCRRLIECEPSDGGPDMTTCNTLFLTAFNCSAATATNTTSIPVCISDVAGESCTTLFDATSGGFNEPGSCSTALDNIPLSDAQNKCVSLVEEACDPTDVCLGQPLANTTDVGDCVTQGVSDLLCQFVTGESATFNQCLSDLCVPPDGGTPDGGAALPASCNDPVTFPPGTIM
jgi:hypothetical protein